MVESENGFEIENRNCATHRSSKVVVYVVRDIPPRTQCSLKCVCNKDEMGLPDLFLKTVSVGRDDSRVLKDLASFAS